MATDDGSEKLVGGCVIAVVQLALTVAASIYLAVVCWYFWGWFVTPATGLASPRLFAVWGIILMLRIVVYRLPNRGLTPEEAKVKHDDWATLGSVLFLVSAAWGIGYVAHLCDGWSSW